MGFMQPFLTREAFITGETTRGDGFAVPLDVVGVAAYRAEIGKVPAKKGEHAIPGHAGFAMMLQPYMPEHCGGPVDSESLSVVVGQWWGRYSAPGYTDCTGWVGPHATRDECLTALVDTYGDDDEQEAHARRGYTETAPDGADVLRRVQLGDTGWALVTWFARTGERGRSYLGYRFGKVGEAPLFTGEDFGVSPMDADDSDGACRCLLGFLTLRPGDTDPEYFEKYTDEQRAFASDHAEELSPWAQEDRDRLEGCAPDEGEPYPLVDLPEE